MSEKQEENVKVFHTIDEYRKAFYPAEEKRVRLEEDPEAYGRQAAEESMRELEIAIKSTPNLARHFKVC